jgi:hypothetical protein
MEDACLPVNIFNCSQAGNMASSFAIASEDRDGRWSAVEGILSTFYIHYSQPKSFMSRRSFFVGLPAPLSRFTFTLKNAAASFSFFSIGGE